MTIAAAARKCLASFDAIDQISVAISPSCLAVEDGRSRYKIWASNLGCMHPETDRRSADYRLREAPEIVSRILELLEELTEVNTEIVEIISGERINRSLSPEDGDSSHDELSELHLSVGDAIASLFKVSMLVKKATKRDRYAKAATAKDDPFLEEFDIRHVADKYPKVQGQPWLLERLGKAITQRRNFLRYCRNHKNRIAHVAPIEPSKERHVPRPDHNDGNNKLLAPSRVVASTTDTPLTRPTLTPTDASTLSPDRIGQGDLQDLDDDDAVSQATSIITSHTNAEDSNMQIPRLEDVSQRGQPFECPFCFSIVQAKSQRSWRKHVLADLRAYVCMSRDCEVALFEDRSAWQVHDAACHRRRWECHYCRRAETFRTAIDLQNHLRSTHNVNEIPEEVLAEVISSSSHPLTEVSPDCPLCDYNDQIRQDAMTKGQQLPDNVQVVVPLEDYHRHIASHQEQLALFAIPPAIERSVESESRHGRSQIDPSEQNQFMARWHKNLEAEDEIEDAKHITRKAIHVTTSDELSPSEAAALGESDREAPPQDVMPGNISIQVRTESELAAMVSGYSRDGSRYYRGHILLHSRTIEDLKLRAERLGQGEKTLDGYADGLVRPIFKQFLAAVDAQEVSEGIHLEDLVRIFYATATTHCSRDNASSYGLWKADVERGAALLVNVLIRIMESDPDVTEEILVQLREKRARMIARVNHEVSAASGLYFKQDFEDQSTEDGLDGGILDIHPQIMEELMRRLHDVIAGREPLPGFDDDFVKRTFAAFSDFLATSPFSEHHSLDKITSELKICALSEISKDEALSHYGTTAMVLRHEALLLSLLISVEHYIQIERHGSAPRIRSRFTSGLMAKRAKVLSAMTEPQGGIVEYFVTPDAGGVRDRHREQDTDRMALSTSHRDASRNDAPHPETTDMERPPRVMRCHQCQHTWTSTLASELTECPQCGSSPVLTESPRRTASPEHQEDSRTERAPGEEALGKYFSERTEKYMNLYRREQPQSSSTTGSQDSFPDPWGHLHGSAKTSKSKLGGTPPESGLLADPPSKTCFTCRHRFTPSSDTDATACPECGSDSIFTDFPWNARPLDNPAADTTEPADNKSTQPNHEDTSPKPSRLVGDVEEMVANLQRLQHRYSGNTADIPEVIDQFLRLSASLKRLANVESAAGFQRVQGTARILCLSIKHTLDVAAVKLHAPFNETQWMMLKFQMSTVEQVSISERLRLYQACIAGLLKHLADYRTGLTADHTDVGSIKSLLGRQTTVGNKHIATMDKPRAEKADESSEPSGSASATQPHRVGPIPRQLASLIDDTKEVATLLHKLNDQHSHNTTDIPETMGQLLNLRDGMKRLSQLSAFETRDHAAFAKVQHSIQVVCQSMQYTFNDVVKVLSKTPDESKWTEWVLLNIRMSDTEHVGFSERLKWYAASVMGVLNHLDGFPSAGRIFQWLGMDSKVKTLLERQESTRSE